MKGRDTRGYPYHDEGIRPGFIDPESIFMRDRGKPDYPEKNPRSQIEID